MEAERERLERGAASNRAAAAQIDAERAQLQADTAQIHTHLAAWETGAGTAGAPSLFHDKNRISD
jgi:hypothetical protein